MQKLLKTMPDVRRDYVRELDTALVESRSLSFGSCGVAFNKCGFLGVCFCGPTQCKGSRTFRGPLESNCL